MELSDFKNKKVLVMGLGLHGGGVGSAAFFARLGSRVIVTDLKDRRELAPSVAKLRRLRNITFHLGGHRMTDFRTADFVIKGPSVPEGSTFVRAAERAGVPVLSDVEVFCLACPATVVGITGTKGKTTATWLAGRFLQKGLRRRVWVGGNIRRSVLEFLPRVKKRDIVVLELSSFQLDLLARSRTSPPIAAITNVFPDHLNRYASFAAYARSKANIFRFQTKKGVLFINGRDPVLGRLARRAPSTVIRFDPERTLQPYRGAIGSRVPAFHLPNIAAAVMIARKFGVGENAIRRVLKRFRGVPGRMQRIRRIGAIEFINDTTATNPEAARQAVIATKRRIGRGRLAVIAGGYDKGLPVEEFITALQRDAASIIFLPGTATEKMKSKIKNQKSKIGPRSKIQKFFEAKTMPEAVRLAYRAAEPSGTVLLSPGAASFGLFRHEFDRGEQFNAAVRSLDK